MPSEHKQGVDPKVLSAAGLQLEKQAGLSLANTLLGMMGACF